MAALSSLSQTDHVNYFWAINAAVPVDMIHPRVLGPNRLAGVTNGLSANVMQAEVLHASLLPGAPATYQDKN